MGKQQQQELVFAETVGWGGWREKAGRGKRKDGVAHASREAVSRHDPRLVTIKRAEGLPSLRTAEAGEVMVECIRKAQRASFRIVHFSIQVNHVHLIVEADDGVGLAAGMKGLLCRFARGLNGVWQRKGAVFPERFHDRVLRSLLQVRNAIRYVLNNYLKHQCPMRVSAEGRLLPDLYSSGIYFDGWIDYPREYEPGVEGAHVARGAWKVARGWRERYGSISLRAMPGGRGVRRR